MVRGEGNGAETRWEKYRENVTGDSKRCLATATSPHFPPVTMLRGRHGGGEGELMVREPFIMYNNSRRGEER